MSQRWSFAFWALLLLSGSVRVRGDESAAVANSVDFAADIAPLLEAHCLRCHKPGNAGGELTLDTRSSLVDLGYLVPGQSVASHLLAVVRPGDDGSPPLMPKEGEPLSAAQVDLLAKWIDAGAEWPEGVVLRERSRADASWWSLQPLADSTAPEVATAPAEWQLSPIDRFVLAKLIEQGLSPSKPADRRTLLRRVTYDLTGLPPTPEDVAAFLADTSPDAYANVVDRLLASPGYGERWGRHWLDVVRFGESRGYERNEIINNAWPFRDYVIRSFNADKPFDQFIREHLAGDVLGLHDPAVEIGTTFLVAGPWDDVGNQDAVAAAQIRADTIDEVVRTTGEAFLGLTIGCSRCHDHKFDPILQEDYYALYATFAGVRHEGREIATRADREARAAQLAPLQAKQTEVEAQIAALNAEIAERAQQQAESLALSWQRPAVDRSGTEELFELVEARFVRLVVEGSEHDPTARTGYKLDEFEVWTAEDPPRNVALAAAGGQANGAGRVAGDFAEAYSAALTIDGAFGARWIAGSAELTIELAQPTVVNRVLFSSDRPGDSVGHAVASFVTEYRVEVSPDGAAWTEVANSYDRHPLNDAHRQHRLRAAVTTPADLARLAELGTALGAVQQEIAAVPALPVWWAGQFRQENGPFHTFVGGDPQQIGKEVTPASLRVTSDRLPAYSLPADAPDTERRRRLADWIVDPANPLTARVLVNRVWQHHFGTGIVDTPSDFGFMGGQPTHPELLDWLARKFVTPVESGGYGWHLKPLHRDLVLSQTYQQSSDWNEAAARQDGDARYLWRFSPRRLDAEEVRDTLLHVAGKLQPDAGGSGFRLYEYLQDNVATYVPLPAHGPETYRRAVYHQNARATAIDLLSDFDQPDCAFSTARRAETTTPLQALTLLNHRFSLDMARLLAERVEREAGTDANVQVTHACQLCYQRDPTEAESAACRELLDQSSLTALCRVLLNTSELIYVE